MQRDRIQMKAVRQVWDAFWVMLHAVAIRLETLF